MNREIPKAITAEDLIRRYNLEGLKKDRKNIQSNKDSLDKANTIIDNFIDAVLKDLNELQNQVDGNITTWFFNGVPKLENKPTIDWDSNSYNAHLGDLYYDQNTGYAYRFALENNNYIWIKITDSDVTKALALANSAQDTADCKRRIFVAEPFTPYDIGDIWLKDDKELYRCRATRKEGQYQSVDWIKATEYTNDDYAKNVEAVLNQFKTTVENDYVTNVKLETTKDSIMSSVESKTTKIEEQILDLDSIKKSETEPTDTNKLWLDLSNNQLKQYTTEGWVVLNDYSNSLKNTKDEIADAKASLEEQLRQLNNYIKTVEQTYSTQFNQSDTQFEMKFNHITTTITETVNDLQKHIASQEQYIRFKEGTITLGNANEKYSLKIENDQINIYYGDTNVSSWIKDIFTARQINIGDFAFIPRPNGSLSFRKIG